MKKMRIPAAKPSFDEKDIPFILEEIKDVLKSGRLILGNYTKRLEESFRDYIGVKHAISVNSCTTALEIVQKHFDVKDSEVITPTNTFIATPNSVLYAGGKPVFADINPETLCIDPNDVLEKLTSKTKGVIVVHMAGLICPHMKEIKEICEDNELFLIEDAAHAHGASINGVKSGSIGDAGCFSFYPTKLMTTCTGGMITTNNDNLADFAKSVRHHGQGESLEQIKRFGNDWCMDEISAILGFYQLKRLDLNIKRRNNIAKIYTDYTDNLEGFSPISVPNGIRHSYYKYVVLLDEHLNKKKIRESLKNKYDIEAGVLYDPPCHLQPAYRDFLGYREGMYPISEKIAKKQLCLPIFSQMTNKEADYVLKCLSKEQGTKIF